MERHVTVTYYDTNSREKWVALIAIVVILSSVLQRLSWEFAIPIAVILIVTIALTILNQYADWQRRLTERDVIATITERGIEFAGTHREWDDAISATEGSTGRGDHGIFFLRVRFSRRSVVISRSRTGEPTSEHLSAEEYRTVSDRLPVRIKMDKSV